MSAHYDVVVLGAGPGGYVAAIRAAQLGLKTAIIEKKWWGGVCLNVGCIPTKALLRNAELAHLVQKEADTFGISGQVSFDYGKAFTRSRQVSERMVKGVHYLMKKNKITEYNGWATFSDARTLQLAGNDGTTDTITFDNVILDTGATVKMLPGTSKSANVLSYEELIMSDSLPESIIIGGSGAIGTEFAYVLNSYGVDVTIVEFLDRMVPNEDADISKELTRQYKKLGIKVLTSTAVQSVVDTGSGVDVTIAPAAGGEAQVLHADKMLQAMGFAPRTEGYGLENTGVALTDRGAVAIDDFCRTNVPGVYAIGDVTAKMMLAHTAEAQGVVAAETIAGAETMAVDYRMIPRATYCQPQIASFGLTEQQARDEGYDVKVAKFPFSANGKAVGMGAPDGFVKIVADGRYNEILGAHMIGEGVTELLSELTLAQKFDLTTEEISRNIHSHPTLGEAVKEAAEGIEGHMTNL
ncbi:dihydrolipoyl dehydrogenase [Propionibacterium freudenreichii]|uniref:dihydrolipoyl dehydrogenase n=1 Tax=Propionibacterium freudenreichii TaxID=1744 RepID=UPI0005443548|nr:dihydrolipoyl dehydrogenase [Propionibacterium freudenreichii]MCT2974016.1 dihydrolipoyl dehydrogenase [Propionibacterium freudenreichii]MCT2975806.1 dihydrolipoyl dehydrogenase [Propionibacterium freudenreichii]MCT2989825.1 dihydrolipoyl dehydrogenase [Propionibacterium freudenreichii]MDK9345557.1 dihydrolipoyl dehydrogenase [Propionibacterium freudenreichii]MDK9350550.1 dihydrolipoyl dehydrogenase [Propionibacterium freudenreichii]